MRDRTATPNAEPRGPAMRPLLMLDVDGVLNPFAVRPGTIPPGFARHTILGYPVLLTPRHGEWLRPMLQRFELVWATTWEHDANRLIAPIVGLPEDARVVRFGSIERIGDWKIDAVAALAGDRPLAWIDDELGSDADRWAHARPFPTLLLRSDPGVGLVRRHVRAFERFADRVAVARE